MVKKIAFILLVVAIRAFAETPEPPTSPDGSVQVSLFAAEPDINTPIGATIDSHGRLLVIESNTHFPPKNYKGHPTDRILALEDTKGTGKADKFTTFYEGSKWTMGIVTDRDGSIVVASRNEIFRLPDKDGVAGEKITLATLQTTAVYPHNGLHGIALDRDGNVYFSMGENFGILWTLVGADGQKISDDRGSGAVYRVDSQGKGLTRICEGFWNPFGLGFDPLNRLWLVDNDPDGRPPCRLVQVAPGGDYGYQLRYGRTGLHPLQAWDGELPGTLGMVAGVGEAPCNVRWQGGRLLVTSWRDHLLQGFTLEPHGAAYTASMQPVLTGGDNFRPVGLALATDGTTYLTDWGSGSYELNGKGRIWKLKFNAPKSPETPLKPTPEMERLDRLRQSNDVTELTKAMGDPDRTTSQAAQYGFSRLPEVEKVDWKSLALPEQRISLLTALMWRGTDMKPYVTPAINDPDVRVRQMGVRVIAEKGIKESRGDLEKMLESPVMSPRLLSMVIAAIAQLDGDAVKGFNTGKIDAILLARLNSTTTADTTRAIALRMLHANHKELKLGEVAALLRSPSQALRLEAVRYLADSPDAARLPILVQVAGDAKQDTDVRAEAVDGLALDAPAQADLLFQLAGGADGVLRQEALRSLRPIGPKLTDAQKQQLAQIAKQYSSEADLVNRAMGIAPAARPDENDVTAWDALAGKAPGDAAAGRRIFFHPAGPGCYNCHTVEGRGQTIGPDLTMIGHSKTRTHVLESILQPSREIAPLFATWRMTLKNGQTFDGMLRNRNGQNLELYVTSDRKEYSVKLGEIVGRKLLTESIMPTGLVQGLTDQELRDLLAMLTEKR